ncbi:MAG: CCA tRNA nucleotidyltransferase [Spirochaetaceae bacterium]|jgi:tRNA nucleotidyltransferase/poly(A) polymerase|nr:CCA tRNA nucleotidyltransferase [Spirochaetaceae bacterium]
MGNLFIHPILKEAAAVFRGRGKKVYLVGGAVRDLFRGQKAQDWDLATDARPEEVVAMFPRVFPTGIKHGTVTVRYKGHSLEVTTFRTESAYTDGRHPDEVRYAADIEEDLSRRDFTMNALAFALPQGPLLDPFGGGEDIKKRIIRCVGPGEERFGEDGLRPIRAVRFAAQLGFTVEDSTLAAIPGALGITARVAPERIREELDKIIAAGKPSTAFLLMEKTGLLELLLPELGCCRGIEQKGFHRFDVLDHSLLACDYSAREGASKNIRLASLFHDIGKPLTRNMDASGIWTFYHHEQESARLTRNILTRFRYPHTVIDEVVHLVSEHMFFYEETWSDAAVRRFIIRVGEEAIPKLLELRKADAYATAGIEAGGNFLVPFINRIEGVLAQGRAFSLKNLAVSGRDLQDVGLEPGPRMGIILRELLETVVDDPELNNREKLLEIAKNLNRRYTPACN